jgi:hypothetical protein
VILAEYSILSDDLEEKKADELARDDPSLPSAIVDRCAYDCESA